jgi:hypothetical protein
VRRGVLAGWLLALPVSGAAQVPVYPRSIIAGGIEARGYSFASGFASGSIRQVSTPIGAVIPFGERLSFDIGTAYAYTVREAPDGTEGEISGLTDTQVRASYVFGQDQVVATLVANLPTGTRTETNLPDLQAAGAISSSFLLFPVNSYTNGVSLTGGLAFAFQSGSWNLGLSAGARVSGEYEPYAGTDVTYQPGLEGRLRLGADRLVGSSRLSLGFTVSDFGTDEFTNGSYRPGNRLVGEATLIAPLGASTLTAYVWDYYRTNSDDGSNTLGDYGNAENLLDAGVTATSPLTRSLSLLSLVEVRSWAPDAGSGFLAGAGLGLRVAAGDHFSLSAGGRLDTGSIASPSGADYDLTGWGATGFVRYEW